MSIRNVEALYRRLAKDEEGMIGMVARGQASEFFRGQLTALQDVLDELARVDSCDVDGLLDAVAERARRLHKTKAIPKKFIE